MKEGRDGGGGAEEFFFCVTVCLWFRCEMCEGVFVVSV